MLCMYGTLKLVFVLWYRWFLRVCVSVLVTNQPNMLDLYSNILQQLSTIFLWAVLHTHSEHHGHIATAPQYACQDHGVQSVLYTQPTQLPPAHLVTRDWFPNVWSSAKFRVAFGIGHSTLRKKSAQQPTTRIFICFLAASLCGGCFPPNSQ